MNADIATQHPIGNLPLMLEEKTLVADACNKELSHWHDALEIIVVEKGEVHCSANGHGIALLPGEICIVNADVMHRLYCATEQGAKVTTLLVRPSMLAQHSDIFDSMVAPFIKDHAQAHVRVTRTHPLTREITQYVEDIREASQKKQAGFELSVLGWIYLLFGKIIALYENNQDIEDPNDQDLTLQRRMNAYIYAHFSEHITLEDIAGAAGVSRTKATNLFRKYTESTPISFLNAYRLEQGARMLEETDLPIGDIALSCGFTDQSYFTRQFIKMWKTSPRKYRLEVNSQ